jgi:hypothetical protein
MRRTSGPSELARDPSEGTGDDDMARRGSGSGDDAGDDMAPVGKWEATPPGGRCTPGPDDSHPTRQFFFGGPGTVTARMDRNGLLALAQPPSALERRVCWLAGLARRVQRHLEDPTSPTSWMARHREATRVENDDLRLVLLWSHLACEALLDDDHDRLTRALTMETPDEVKWVVNQHDQTHIQRMELPPATTAAVRLPSAARALLAKRLKVVGAANHTRRIGRLHVRIQVRLRLPLDAQLTQLWDNHNVLTEITRVPVDGLLCRSTMWNTDDHDDVLAVLSALQLVAQVGAKMTVCLDRHARWAHAPALAMLPQPGQCPMALLLPDGVVVHGDGVAVAARMLQYYAHSPNSSETITRVLQGIPI